MITGLDISSVQGTVNFAPIVSAGIQFVILKAYQGNDFVDLTYAINLQSAQAHGLATGSYNFLYPLPTSPAHPNRDPLSQAQLHVAATKTSFFAADLEWPDPSLWAQWGCSASQVSDWGLAYLNEVERLTGKTPHLYTYPFFAHSCALAADYRRFPLWLASYAPSPVIPSPWADWSVWQTGQGKLPGTNVSVDTNTAKDISIFY